VTSASAAQSGRPLVSAAAEVYAGRSMLGTHVSARPPRSPLRSPLFWLALLVLVVNDHLLKGGGLVPGWLTGKLSDFAGLIVAPLAAAELCRGRLRGLRIAAASLVVAVFVATELHAPAARALEHAFGLLGLGIRLWPDPTDLLALAVLPWTAKLLSPPRASRTLAAPDRFALALACLACVATSDAASYQYLPFLVNHSGDTLDLRVRFHDRVSCDLSLEALAAELEAGVQRDEHALRLEPTQVVSFEAAPLTGLQHTLPGCGRHVRYEVDDAGVELPASCVALRIEGDGLAPHVLRAPRDWEREDEGSRCAPRIPVYEDPGEGALVITRGSASARRLVAHERIEVIELP
jgi:hypothetical protein